MGLLFVILSGQTISSPVFFSKFSRPRCIASRQTGLEAGVLAVRASAVFGPPWAYHTILKKKQTFAGFPVKVFLF